MDCQLVFMIGKLWSNTDTSPKGILMLQYQMTIKILSSFHILQYVSGHPGRCDSILPVSRSFSKLATSASGEISLNEE